MSVEMKLELGHRAVMREQPTPEGFTHDWMVFVKGAEGSDIQHFVDKVVFYLHESFPKPKRVVKEPPYQVAESGYAGFMMPIEVYFRNKEEPKKVRFEYDLFLRIESSPVYNIRREKLTFQNPSDDFRRKLLKARGVGSGTAVSGGTPSLQTQTTAPIQHVDEPLRPLTTHTKPTPSIAEKKPKSHSAIKEPIKTTPPPPPPPPPAPVTKASQQFTDIFGSVIKTKPSPDLSSKNKEISHSSHPKQNKSLQPPSGPVGNVASKEPKSASKVGHSPEGKETKSKLVKSEKEPKSSSLKRPLPPDGQNHPGAIEKKKKYHSNSETGEKHTDGSKTKDTKEKKEKHRSKTSGHVGKKEKHKTSSHHTTNKDHISKSPKAVNNVKPPSPDRLSNDDSNDAKSSIKQEEENVNSPADYLVDATSTWCEIAPGDMDDAVERDLISPLSPDIKHSPAPVPEKLRRSSNHDTEDSMDEKPIKPVKVEKSPKPKNISKTRKSASQVNSNNNNNSSSSSVHRSSKQNGSMKENHLSPSESKVAKAGKVALDPAYVKELVDLQKKIMALEDRSLLQRVVEVIEETGRFQMTNKSFDFDLCSLDQSTVRKLKHCLAS